MLAEFAALVEIAAQFASDPEYSVHTPPLALRQKSPTGKAAVTEQDIPLSEMLPKPLQESQFLGSQGLLGPVSVTVRKPTKPAGLKTVFLRVEAKRRRRVAPTAVCDWIGSAFRVG